MSVTPNRRRAPYKLTMGDVELDLGGLLALYRCA
jgi:hypothetical protein